MLSRARVHIQTQNAGRTNGTTGGGREKLRLLSRKRRSRRSRARILRSCLGGRSVRRREEERKGEGEAGIRYYGISVGASCRGNETTANGDYREDDGKLEKTRGRKLIYGGRGSDFSQSNHHGVSESRQETVCVSLAVERYRLSRARKKIYINCKEIKDNETM